MKGDQIQKTKILADGEEIEGLINLPEYEPAEGVIQIPGYNKSVPVKDGTTVIPEIPMTFKVTRGSKTRQFFLDWKDRNQVKDCVIIRLDGKGQEIDRELWPNTECSKVSRGGFDASAVAVAPLNVTLLPEDIIPIDGES